MKMKWMWWLVIVVICSVVQTKAGERILIFAAESENPQEESNNGGLERNAVENTKKNASIEEDSAYLKLQEALLGELNFDEVQKMIEEALGSNSLSIWDMLKSVMSGELPLSKEAVQDMLRSLFFSRILQEKDLLAKIVMLIFMAAIFHVFTEVFDSGQLGNISFYMVYLLLFIFLADYFAEMSSALDGKLSWITDFMKGLAPAYYMTVAASTGITTAAVFYQGVLLLVMAIQWGLKSIVLPCVNLYVLLMFVNHLSKEEMVSKLADLLYTLIGWILKTFMAMIVGLQVVRSLVTPVVDSLKRGLVGKTASAIPGIGNAVNTVTELMLTGAILVRNSLGVVILLVLLVIAADPVIHYLFMSLAFRFLAAVAQPVSDKRIVSCLSTMGEGCMLLLRIFFHAIFLCVVTFLILMVSFGGRG